MAPGSNASLTIVGLGPGDASLLTGEALDVLAAAGEVWLRTARHPTVAGLPAGPRYESFDEAYESSSSFEDVYARIVGRVLELAARPAGVVYAVPGHPLFGEATVRKLLERAEAAGMSVRLVAGVSFLDAAATALRLDPLAAGLLLLDALDFAEHRRLLAPQRPTLIAQVHDRRTASRVKLSLLDGYPPEHAVRILRAAGSAGERIVETTVAEMDRSEEFDHLALLYVPALAPTEDVRSFEGLRAVVARLRAPDGGCPWDLQQTHASLRRYLIEEAYEALDALDRADPGRLAEELGDLMMQVLLHAQVAEDTGEFAIEDVIRSIAVKLIRRHPHVFGDVEVGGAEDVLRNWEVLKTQERGDEPLLDHVPRAMPALAQAQSVQSRATKAGLGGAPDTATTLQRLGELADAPRVTPDALGDVLMGIVALARACDIDAEDALRTAIARYRDEVGAAEAARRAGGG